MSYYSDSDRSSGGGGGGAAGAAGIVGTILLVCVVVGLKITARTAGRALSRHSFNSYDNRYEPPPGDPNFYSREGARQTSIVRSGVPTDEGERIDATPSQRRMLEKLFWAGRQVIDNNQDRLNVKGIAWKNFLPAKWEREMGQVFTARTGIIIKQPGRTYRSPVNVPDELERSALQHYVNAGRDESRPQTAFTTMGKQAVYRHLEPIRLLDACLPCHGKPKGEPDMLGYAKDGLEAGDLIGLMSVTVAVED